METIPACILKHILVDYFTYREQCNLVGVCYRWYTILILDDPESYKGIFKLIARIIKLSSKALRDWKDHHEIYQLLCKPEYRLIFVHPMLRHARVRITYLIQKGYHNIHQRANCVLITAPYHIPPLDLSVSAGGIFVWEYQETHSVLEVLYKKLDAELTLSHDRYYIYRYWSKIRREKAPPTDLSHDQYQELFG
jgi:hypothetical protein